MRVRTAGLTDPALPVLLLTPEAERALAAVAAHAVDAQSARATVHDFTFIHIQLTPST